MIITDPAACRKSRYTILWY